MTDMMKKVIFGFVCAMALLLATCSNKKSVGMESMDDNTPTEVPTIAINTDSTFLTFRDGTKALVQYEGSYNRFKIYGDSCEEACEFQWAKGRTWYPYIGMRTIASNIVYTRKDTMFSPYYSFNQSGRVGIMVDSIRPITLFKDYKDKYNFYYEGLMTCYHDNGFVSGHGWILFEEDADPITAEFVGKWNYYDDQGRLVSTKNKLPYQ